MGNTPTSYRTPYTKEWRRSFYVGLLILLLSLIFQYYAGIYSASRAGQYVGDVVLDNIPVVNLNPVIVEGALWAIVGSIFLLSLKPRYIIFSMKAVAVFLAIRAFFIAATHLGIYPGQVIPGNGYFDQWYVAMGLETGFFFSAHTGLTFFMALIFWKEKLWRWVYLALSIIFGASVLLAHVHYSIDVFAAPFMAYSIFKLSEYLFREDFLITRDH